MDAHVALEAEIAAADLDDTDPVNYMGLCGAADAQGTVMMWIGAQPVSFAPFCLFEGIVAVYEKVSGIQAEVSDCQEVLIELESVAPGCRTH